MRHSAFTWLHKNRGMGPVLVDDLETVEAEQINERNPETPETVLMARDDAMRLEATIDALPTAFREALGLSQA